MYRIFLAGLMSLIICSFLIPATDSGATESEHLRLALLPIPDVLPIYVAEEKGYFAEMGLVVETLSVGSAVERDQLMQAGRIDGMINEISGAASFNRNKNQVKIVSIARSPLGVSPLFRILAAPDSGLKSISDTDDIPIGVSKNTVIEYITSRLLEAGGLSPESIQFQSVPVLPERLQLLLAGRIQLATLPDPLATSAIEAGAIEIINDTTLADVSSSVITFSTTSVKNKKKAVQSFMIAWDKAVADLNSDPNSFRELMLKKIRVPKNIQQSYRIPPLPRRALPTKAQWDDVMEWMVMKKLLVAPLPYDQSVTAEFLSY